MFANLKTARIQLFSVYPLKPPFVLGGREVWNFIVTRDAGKEVLQEEACKLGTER